MSEMPQIAVPQSAPEPQTIEELVDTAIANGSLDHLREEYGLVLTVDGRAIHVEDDTKFRDAVREGMAEGRIKGETAAKAIGQGAKTVGQRLLYTLVDVPVEGSKTLGSVVKTKAKEFGRNRKQAKHERLVEMHNRKVARQQARADRKAAKAAEKQAQSEETTTE